MRTSIKPAIAGFLWAVMLLAVAGAVRAQAVCPPDADCMSWGYAATYTDGSAISTADIDGVIIEVKVPTGWQHVAMVKYPATSYTRQPVTGTQTYRARQVMKSGAAGAFTESTNAPIPGPIEFKVVDNRAYRMILGYANQIKIEQVGTVALDVRCTGFRVMDLFVIADRQKAVIAAGKSRPLQVLARCA